jgi:hypothetical protein
MSKKNRKNNEANNAAGGAEEEVTASEKSQLTSLAYSGPEDQKQRWVKYGSNVALVTLVAIALAVLVTYLAQRSRLRVDTTQSGDNSLKPQTVEILRTLDQPVKLVSLYTETKPVGGTAQANQVDYAGRVRDLLDEYKRNSTKIDVEAIDPEANPTKVDDLIAEMTEKYGGEVKKYREFLNRWPDRYKQIRALATQEVGEVAQLTQSPLEMSAGQRNLLEAAQSILERTRELEALQTTVDRRLRQRPPDYKGATSDIQTEIEEFGSVLGQIVQIFEGAPGMKPKTRPTTGPATAPATQPSAEEAAADAKRQAEEEAAARQIPKPLREYIARSLPQYRELKRLADETVDQISKLGDLKLDELRQKLRERNAILVLGPDEMRSLSFNDVWQTDPDMRQMLRAGGAPEQMKPRFAGEQQVSTAILGLVRKKKPVVVFVRPGGAPLTTVTGPFQPPGPLRRVAQRLRDYNFDVMEKDLSGMWAMQSQRMGAMMPPEPEATDEQMKDAVWVVVATGQSSPMGGPTGDLGQKLEEHLNRGGAAMVLAAPRGSEVTGTLSKWGIDLNADSVVVHEEIPATGASGEQIERILRIPFIFGLSHYGEHAITHPMRSLDSLVIASVVLKTKDAPGVKVTPLLTPPTGLKVWGESDLESISESSMTFEPKPLGDVAPPVLMGVAAEKPGGGRLVVFGGFQSFINDVFAIPDADLARKGYPVARFPGNGELFANSVFWLSKMDTMIAISPAAMEVSRIKDMSSATLGFWRWGFLVVGLPLAVVVAGAMVYMGRRD